jgi:hypothetical protein
MPAAFAQLKIAAKTGCSKMSREEREVGEEK